MKKAYINTLLLLAFAGTSHAALVTGLDGIADSSTMVSVANWTAESGSIRSYTNVGGSTGMIHTNNSGAVFTAQYESIDLLLANTEYTMETRVGHWSSTDGSGATFTIDIGYVDGGTWTSLGQKSLQAPGTGEISPTANGVTDTLTFTTGDTVTGNVAVRVARTNTEGRWAGFDYVTLDAAAVPEPSSATLLGLGGLALILRRRK
ncbi:PEP-CTERM sorting domain-containing protein [Verrucomicrobiaceae bacterium N1E253]|uniref:PEP-CTERM sorting domain-containing protein n=1 Tax=Oceaniferula marina TaxID=2748318 RepID=A0A851GKH4_9BACT|nr:PEP-CTERM sorting domain-containing protein [Oceaniferula marina]NWK55675.1 PEP-CTERM sorting domain-containing protein [Oceaniferula marina]